MFKKSDSKMRQEEISGEYNDFKDSLIQQLKDMTIQPEHAMESLRAKYVECTGKIEDINREDPNHRVNVFNEVLGGTMQINKKFSLLGMGGGVALPDKSETDKGLLITDEGEITVLNVKDAENIEYELSGTSWYKWSAMFGGKPFELNNLRCLKALIRTQYILMRQNNLIVEQLRSLNNELMKRQPE